MTRWIVPAPQCVRETALRWPRVTATAAPLPGIRLLGVPSKAGFDIRHLEHRCTPPCTQNTIHHQACEFYIPRKSGHFRGYPNGNPQSGSAASTRHLGCRGEMPAHETDCKRYPPLAPKKHVLWLVSTGMVADRFCQPPDPGLSATEATTILDHLLQRAADYRARSPACRRAQMPFALHAAAAEACIRFGADAADGQRRATRD